MLVDTNITEFNEFVQKGVDLFMEKTISMIQKEQEIEQSDFAKSFTKWLPVILGALVAIGPLSIDMYLPALPQLAGEFSTTASLVQMSLTACLIGMAVGQMFAGPFSDVLGRRKPLLIGLVIFALASIACAFSTSIWALLGLRLIQGLAGSAGVVISRAIARDLYSGYELTKFFAMLMLVNGVAPIAAPVLGGQILAFSSWRAVFICLTFIGILLTIAVVFFVKESLLEENRLSGGLKSTLDAVNSLIRQRYFMGHCLMQGCAFSALFAYISGSPFVLQNIYGVSPQVFSLVFAINGIGLIIAGQLTGRLSGKVSDVKLLEFGVILAIVGSTALMSGIFFKGNLYMILVPLFFTASSLAIVASSSFSLAMQKQGKMAGSAAALIGFFSNITGGIMAPLVGIAGSHNAMPMGVVIMVSEICAGLCFWFMIKPAHKKVNKVVVE
jgi:DHA1 family bicyclomycin/chloramphenicol resistance-like MFS transporter